MVKRIVGRLLVMGIMSSGIAVAAAGPSSAMPRNTCMDEVHWWQTLSSLNAAAENAWDIYLLWEDAYSFVDDSGATRYYVTFYDGHTVSGLTLDQVQNQQTLSHTNWNTAFTAAYDFYNNMAICTL